MKKRQWISGVVVGACVLAVTACERHPQIRVPDQKADFVGRWSAGSNYFDLEPDGTVSLEIEDSGRALLVRDGSLRRLDDEAICFGVGELQAGDCLEISKSPYAVDGRDRIEIGGVELERE